MTGTLAGKDLWKFWGSGSLLHAAGLSQHSSAMATTSQPSTNPRTQGHQDCPTRSNCLLQDFAVSNQKQAFKHSAPPSYMPPYLLHRERRQAEVTKLFSNGHDTALFRYLHKQPDFSEV